MERIIFHYSVSERKRLEKTQITWALCFHFLVSLFLWYSSDKFFNGKVNLKSSLLGFHCLAENSSLRGKFKQFKKFQVLI